MRLSPARSSAVIPSCKTYKVSRESAAILIPRPFGALIVGLSASFVVTSAHYGSTMVFFIRSRKIYYVVVVLTVRLVERVPT